MHWSPPPLSLSPSLSLYLSPSSWAWLGPYWLRGLYRHSRTNICRKAFLPKYVECWSGCREKRSRKELKTVREVRAEEQRSRKIKAKVTVRLRWEKRQEIRQHETEKEAGNEKKRPQAVDVTLEPTTVLTQRVITETSQTSATFCRWCDAVYVPRTQLNKWSSFKWFPLVWILLNRTQSKCCKLWSYFTENRPEEWQQCWTQVVTEWEWSFRFVVVKRKNRIAPWWGYSCPPVSPWSRSTHSKAVFFFLSQPITQPSFCKCDTIRINKKSKRICCSLLLIPSSLSLSISPPVLLLLPLPLLLSCISLPP